MPAPLFSTCHAPVGAWMSLTFGGVLGGLALQQESLDDSPNADLLVAWQREGTTVALPFVRNTADFPAWEFPSADAISRNLTACVDEFVTGGLTFRVYTPQAALPNPKRAGNLQFASAPGLLLEVTVDNSMSDSPATALVGLRTARPVRPVDWASKTLCGVARSSQWILAANVVKDEVATLHSENLGDLTPRIDPAAQSGGVVIKVAPRSSKTVALVFAGYQAGLATQGIDGRYYYTNYFPRVEAVANFLLHNAQRVRESAASFDARAAAACGSSQRLGLFARAVRAYNARTQVVEAATPAGAVAHFAAMAPRGARNCLGRAADHLPWELFRNPWVIRNLFDLATTTYAYRDQVRFPGDTETPEELREGGMTFTRDFGFATAYAPSTVPGGGPGRAGGGPVSAFDGARGGAAGPGWSGGKLASEVLLNSIYMLTSYALAADDTPWAKTRLPFARELLLSLENRDHWDPAKRTGILKAESAAANGPEETAFAGGVEVPTVLAQARGNLYLAVKTFCANLMLTTYFTNNNDLHSADYSYAFAQKTAASLVAAFNKQTGAFSANLLTADNTVLVAALEPLALPTYLGLTSTLSEYFPDLFAALQTHVATCLKASPEGCMDGNVLRLASNSACTCAGKVIAILYVLERLFRIEAAVGGIWEQLAAGGKNDPEVITSALFVKPVAAAGA
jgi:xylan 1,4-beta-xylosidase